METGGFADGEVAVGELVTGEPVVGETVASKARSSRMKLAWPNFVAGKADLRPSLVEAVLRWKPKRCQAVETRSQSITQKKTAEEKEEN